VDYRNLVVIAKVGAPLWVRTGVTSKYTRLIGPFKGRVSAKIIFKIWGDSATRPETQLAELNRNWARHKDSLD
jgi:hypothetical protein